MYTFFRSIPCFGSIVSSSTASVVAPADASVSGHFQQSRRIGRASISALLLRLRLRRLIRDGGGG